MKVLTQVAVRFKSRHQVLLSKATLEKKKQFIIVSLYLHKKVTDHCPFFFILPNKVLGKHNVNIGNSSHDNANAVIHLHLQYIKERAGIADLLVSLLDIRSGD